MTFYSILFARAEEGAEEETFEMPTFFVDLNLDQIIDAVTSGTQEYNLKPFFYTSLHNINAINYRYEIMRDLENKTLFESIKSFADKMRAMREHLARVDKLYYQYQKESWFLDAVELYCEAVDCLVQDLTVADLKSRGFLAFRQYMMDYFQSEGFTLLLGETKQLKADLSSVQYCLLIKDNRIQVRQYESEKDYSAEVEETFGKFRYGAVKDYRVKVSDYPDMNHIEAKILDFVAGLYPRVFLDLNHYWAKNSGYLDEKIGAFDREIQFYVAYLEHIAKFKQAGLRFCYPHISDTGKDVYDYEGFDLALANKLIADNSPVVCNDFCLKGKERLFIVTGANQGGKTTFARTFGQLHYLAGIGCPVPGREAGLFLADRLFTHFEKEEDINNLRGKLQDELVRIHDILNQATPNSIVIINEIFTSTTLEDAIFLSKKIIETIIQLDLLGVCVTFIDELASLDEKTVSMVATVVPHNPAARTYKIERRSADRLSYAISIAEKHRLLMTL